MKAKKIKNMLRHRVVRRIKMTYACSLIEASFGFFEIWYSMVPTKSYLRRRDGAAHSDVYPA